jgi:phenylpropionate dioxygenase-like ring-hydroxylating dioxygenase large terminal subunit
MPCFVNNPENINKPMMRNYKTKEKNVVEYITQSFNGFTWVSDKKIQDGCSRRRPDLLLDMGTHIIIVEIDENKHTDYDCSCEHKRLMELSQDLQHRPIVFIRFNPDDYINQNGELIKSCWKLNKLGIMQISKTKQNEWDARLYSLKQQIQYWIDNSTEKTIEIIELFY